MAERLKRASFARIAVGLAALAFPLFAVGTAQAAVGGAAPESSNRADLVSATALDNNDVDFCFDKQITNTAFTATDFSLSGYRWNRTITATTAAYEQTVNTTGTCVRASFNGTGTNAVGDIGNYTVASVATGSGVKTVNGLVNYNAPVTGDSTALTVPASLSPTHNGTTGFTIAPDLVSVTTDPTINTITYTEDQAIGNAPVMGSFTFTRSGGTLCTGNGTPVVSGNTVTVPFNPTTCPVADAQRAGQTNDALVAAADPLAVSPPETVVVPNQTGTTSRPDLVSATLNSTKTAISFVFDKSVANPVAGDFEAVSSLGAGGILFGTGTPIITAGPTAGTSTVTVTFTGLSLVSEYIVEGAVLNGAVTDINLAGNVNVADSRPAGDNAGAFARGFTTGPDATSAVLNKTTGVVSITLDQRLNTFGFPGAAVYVLDNTGTAVFSAPSSAIGVPSGLAGPQTITAQFSPAQLSTAVNVYIPTGSLITNAGQSNVNQILAATSTSTLLKRAEYARSHHASKRAVKKHNALVRKYKKGGLKRLERFIHHA